MNASNLLIVTRSRTFGTLRTTTLSAVSSAAAIAGSAEFFAPLIATAPRSAFPPLIRNLSIHALFAVADLQGPLFLLCVFCVSVSSGLNPFLIHPVHVSNCRQPQQAFSLPPSPPLPASTSPA